MKNNHFILLFIYLIWLHHVACEILVPQPGIEPGPTAVKVLISKH